MSWLDRKRKKKRILPALRNGRKKRSRCKGTRMHVDMHTIHCLSPSLTPSSHPYHGVISQEEVVMELRNTASGVPGPRSLGHPQHLGASHVPMVPEQWPTGRPARRPYGWTRGQNETIQNRDRGLISCNSKYPGRRRVFIEKTEISYRI